MDWFYEMSWFRKILLIIMAAMVVGFGVATPIMTSIPGIAYSDGFFRMEEQGGSVLYSGRLDGEDAVWTVLPDGAVEYRWGEYTYGPYQVVEDSAASPKGSNIPGIEIRRGDETLFRGGYAGAWLLQEDGTPWNLITIRAHTNSGEVIGENGPISQEELHEPSLSYVARLAMGDQVVTHRGSFGFYLLVTLVGAFNVVQICFPKMMFQLSLLGRVRNIDDAEPSDFYIAMEHVEWVFLAIVTLVLYWMTLAHVVD